MLKMEYIGILIIDMLSLCADLLTVLRELGVFLELGYYFENKAFYNIAEQAFRYEDAKYDKSKKNWPDFRIRHSKKHYKTAYLEENWNFFNKPKFMTAWCHGAPGI